MKNADIKAKMRLYGVEWIEVARYLGMPLKDLERRLNGKQASPQFRKHLHEAIEAISRRSETFYDDFK